MTKKLLILPKEMLNDEYLSLQPSANECTALGNVRGNAIGRVCQTVGLTIDILDHN